MMRTMIHEELRTDSPAFYTSILSNRDHSNKFLSSWDTLPYARFPKNKLPDVETCSSLDYSWEHKCCAQEQSIET
jgi:hypothetical protein